LSTWDDHRAPAWDKPIKPGANVGRAKTTLFFAKVSGVIKFVDKGSGGRFCAGGARGSREA